MILKDILQDLLNQNNGFKGLVQKLTKDLKSRILEETKNLPLKSQFDERIYNILNYHQIPVCDKGNQFKFKSFTEGYARFCGANCECANSKRAEFRTNFAKNRSKEDKDKTEQKKKTSIEEARKWVPTSTFDFDDLVDYLKERIEKCKKNQGVVYKTLPYFIEDEIKKHTSYLPEETLLNERVYNILHPGNRKTCSCGNPSKFHSFNVGYRKYCSSNCEGFNKDHSEHMKEHYKNLSEEEKQRRVEKQQETSLENWGYTSHMKSPEYMKEYQQNLLDKFGVTNVFEIPEIKEKNKKNNLEKYGVEYPFQNSEFQAAALEKSKEAHGGEYCKKAREAYKEKTGFDSCFQDPEWQEKNRELRKERTGSASPVGTQEVRDKMKEKELETYNRNHHMQRSWTDETFDILNDKELFLENFKKYGSVQSLAKHLQSSSCVVYDRVREYCPEKIKSKSLIEDNIESLLQDLKVNYKKNDRKILNGLELDFYFPDYNLAIEYDSFYFHRIEHPNLKGNINYHREKTDACDKMGIQLIHIFQDEWFDKKDIVESKIINLLGYSEKGIGARKLKIKIIDFKTASDFLDSRHLQGKVTGASIHYGAYSGEYLVGVMSFGKIKDREYDLKRFATDGRNHPGLASKLLKHFIRDYNPDKIISFADRRWSTGNVYERLGFENVGIIPVDYSYVLGSFYRYHKFNFRRDKLLKLLNLPDTGQTEKELAKLHGLDRIYDCGKIKYVLDLRK